MKLLTSKNIIFVIGLILLSLMSVQSLIKKEEIGYTTWGVSMVCDESCQTNGNYDAIKRKFNEHFPKNKDWQLRGLNNLDFTLTDVEEWNLLFQTETFTELIYSQAGGDKTRSEEDCPSDNQKIGFFSLIPSYYAYEKYPQNFNDDDMLNFVRSLSDLVEDKTTSICAVNCAVTTPGVYSGPLGFQSSSGSGGSGVCLAGASSGTSPVFNMSVAISTPPVSALPATKTVSFSKIYQLVKDSVYEPEICEWIKQDVTTTTTIPESVTVTCYEALVNPFDAPCSNGLKSIQMVINYNENEIGNDEIDQVLTDLVDASFFGAPDNLENLICNYDIDGFNVNLFLSPFTANSFGSFDSCKTSHSYLFNQKSVKINSNEKPTNLKRGKKQLNTCIKNELKNHSDYKKLSRKDKKLFLKSEYKSYKSTTKKLSSGN